MVEPITRSVERQLIVDGGISDRPDVLIGRRRRRRGVVVDAADRRHRGAGLVLAVVHVDVDARRRLLGGRLQQLNLLVVVLVEVGDPFASALADIFVDLLVLLMSSSDSYSEDVSSPYLQSKSR